MLSLKIILTRHCQREKFSELEDIAMNTVPNKRYRENGLKIKSNGLTYI